MAKLKAALAEAETTWDDEGASYAAQISREARDHVATVERAAAAGDWSGVKAGVNALNQTCGTCHTIYRERQNDGTFRIKPGSL